MRARNTSRERVPSQSCTPDPFYLHHLHRKIILCQFSFMHYFFSLPLLKSTDAHICVCYVWPACFPSSFLSSPSFLVPLVQFPPLLLRSRSSFPQWISPWNYEDGITTFPPARMSIGGRNISEVTSNKMLFARCSWVNR